MSVIIRLQNLPWSANALDIRQHFQGLSIPEGGVHIVGGEQGDAFIAFSTDEDARQAMMTDGGKIKEVKLKLMLSSRTEMQKVIEQARQQSLSLQNLLQMPAPPITTTVLAPTPVPAAVELAKVPDRRDSDATSNSSKDKDRRNDRKDRSRSRDRSRRDRDRRSRRSRSRDRNRRRRSRDRSRDRSKERERKRTIARDDTRRDSRRDSMNKDDSKNSKDQNGSNVNKTPGIQETSVNVWDLANMNAPNKIGNFNKAALLPNRNLPAPMDINVGRGDMDGRRIMGSGPFQPAGRPMLNDTMQGPFQGNREGWQGAARFPNNERQPGFMGEPARSQGFSTEGNDFDGRGDFGPRAGNFRGGNFRGNNNNGADMRRPFLPGRPGAGPGNILGPPGAISNNSFPRGPGPMDNFQRNDRFENFPNRSFSNDRFNRNYDPRSHVPGSCVEVRNIPIDASYSDLRKFFQGLFVANNAIKMLNDNNGKRVGIAYMKFSTPNDKDRAIKLSGKQIRGTLIEVAHINDEFFEKAIDSFKPEKSEVIILDNDDSSQSDKDISLSCLHVQDLPPYTKEIDIFKLFHELEIADIVFSANDERKPFMAYIKFKRTEDAKKALYSNTKHMIGHTVVRVALCTMEQFQTAKKELKSLGVNGSPAKDPRSRGDKELVNNPSLDCILLKGLPYQTNDRDILDFFSDVALVPLRIHIMLDNFNKPSGDAYCEFASCDETARAVLKHNTMLGKQEIIVKPVMRAEMLEALGLTLPPDIPNYMHNGPRPPFNRNFGVNRPMGILGTGPHRMPMMGPGRPMGSMPGPMMGPGPMPHLAKDAPIEGFGKPGCVLALENIPFRSEIEEILEFFSDFDVSRENVIRRFNDGGMPTGDARVSFVSSSEANRAAAQLRGNTIRGRPIFLSVL